MPLVAASLPLWGLTLLGSRGWERGACVAMVGLAALCVWQGYRRHRRWWLLALLGAGAMTTLGTQFLLPDASPLDDCCASQPDWIEAGLMFCGGLAIATSHVLNLHYRRKCHCRLCPGAVTESRISSQDL